MSKIYSRLVVVLGTLIALPVALAGDDPRHQRHELMENVRDSAKPVGEMLKGEREFDADVLMQSLQMFADAGQVFGDLFPEGTETGEGTEAAPAIWEDRAGFNKALMRWRQATDAAIAADPQSLDDARLAMQPVFGACKNCHDTYRLEDE